MIERYSDIVITGASAISAAGVGLEPLRAAVAAGESCLKPVPEEILPGGFSWGRAESFKATDFIPPLKARKLDRCSQFAVVAAGQALADAGIARGDLPPDRIGIVLGCGFGGIANSEEFLTGYFSKGMDGLAPMLFPNTVANAPASNASIEYGLQGPNVTIVQRFCSAESAFQMACRFLDEGRADVILTGGVDDVTPRMMQAFREMRQLRRWGSGYGEGAGLVVLERRAHAERRGARMRALVSAVATIGHFLPGATERGLAKLLGPAAPVAVASLSGVADLLPEFEAAAASAERTVALQRISGRALAMGGLSVAVLSSMLGAGESALHIGASPEGPYFAFSLLGGPAGAA